MAYLVLSHFKNTRSVAKDNFWLVKVQVSKQTKTRKLIFGTFFGQTAPLKPNPPKNVETFLQIPNRVQHTEILAPELEGDQSEIIV